MFEFNATLLLQMLHFFIAYLITRFLIIKPVIALISRENEMAASLKATIQERQTLIEEKKAEITTYWRHLKELFAQLSPRIFAQQDRIESKVRIHKTTADIATRERKAQELAAEIIAQVDHVR